MKLKYRLFALFLAAIAVGSVASLVLVRRSTESMFRSFVFSGDSRKAESYAVILAEYRAVNGDWDGVQAFLSGLPEALTDTIDTRIYGEGSLSSVVINPAITLRSLVDDRVVVADGRGIIVADTANTLLGTAHPERHLSHGVPIVTGSDRAGTVLVGSMIDSSLTGTDDYFLRSVTRSIAWSTAAAAAIALVLGLFFASRITRPLGSLARAARAVASGEPSAPVRVSGWDEVADLSLSFNEMTGELRRLDAAKKQVIADAAHELRTPVTLIRGIVEGMIDGVFPRDDKTLESVREETDRLSRLIDTLRELEIIESGALSLDLEDVNLREAAERACALFAPAAEAKGISLALEATAGPPPLTRGDRLRLDEVLYNLIANAIKYTPEGGRVTVRERERDDGFAALSVEDSGPGVPIEERSRVFERFYRIDKSRSSSTGGRGLGLAIAAQIVKAHGGDITVGESPLGGASFTVAFPRLGPVS